MDSSAKGEGIGKTGDEDENMPPVPHKGEERRLTVAKEVFKYSLKTVLYFTSDDVPFYEESDALKHAASLYDKTVITVNKEQ